MKRWQVIYSDIPLVSSEHYFRFAAKSKARLMNNSNAIRKYPVAGFPAYMVRKKPHAAR